MKNLKRNKEKWIKKVDEIMELGGKSKATFSNYRSHISKFLEYYPENTEINKLDEDDILAYFKENYIDKNIAASTLNVAVCSIKFFFVVNFKKELNSSLLPTSKLKKKIPTIIDKDLFIKIFNNEGILKHKCWLILAFCSGLRVEEVATLRIENIFSSEHKLKILGKGNKERFTILPDITINILRLYYKEQHITDKQGYLFKGTGDLEHINSKTIINFFTCIKEAYNLPKEISFHSLRHSFATYYMLNGGNLLDLKMMLGHRSIVTTTIYLHMAQDFNNLEGINYAK